MLTHRCSRENETLRKVLKSFRKEVGLTQGELALRLGVPQSFVSKYECGERTLSFVDVHLICHALTVPFSNICHRFEEEIGAPRT